MSFSAKPDDKYKLEGDVTSFKYDATVTSNNRRSPIRVVKSEDKQLNAVDRKVLIASTRDLRRNMTALRWVIDKHLDFVVKHTLHCKTGDPGLDREIEEYITEQSKASNFDVTGRHPLHRYLRMIEAARVVDGDVFTLKLRNGTVQAIEGDRVRNLDGYSVMQSGMPTETLTQNWHHGIRVDQSGRPITYAVHRRRETGFEFERNVSARRIIPLGYYDRFDQYRGISPLASAINTFQDLYESFGYSLAKGKVSQMFALAISRDDTDGLGTTSNECTIDFSDGPQVLDLGMDEDAKFLSVNAPEADTAAFWDNMISLCLKSLSIPYSFYREDFTNFFGSRSAMQLYLRSVESKRADVVDWLNSWCVWKLRRGLVLGDIRIPNDLDLDRLPWKWIPAGVEYFNPVQEATADLMLINSGLATRSEIRMDRKGDDWRDVVQKLSEEQQLMDDVGIRVVQDAAGESVAIGGDSQNILDPQESESEDG